MPAVGTAVAGFLGLGGTIAGAVVAGAVNLGISFGLSYLAQALAPPPAGAATAGYSGEVQVGGNVPRSFIYGQYATYGSLAYVGTWGEDGSTPNAYLVQVIPVSDLPVGGLAGMLVDGGVVTFDPNASQTGKGYPVPEYKKSDKDHLWVRFHDGNQVAADDYLVNKFSTGTRPWTSAAVGTGIAYLVVTSLATGNLFTGIPKVRAVVDGIALYDVRNDDTAGGDGDERWSDPSTWSPSPSNPAVVAYNLMRGIRYGGQWFYGLQTVSAAQLPFSSWAAAANECDLTVTNADESTAKQYVVGGEVTVSVEPGQELTAIFMGCNGRMADAWGTYKMHVGAASAPVLAFNDEDLLSSESQTLTPFPELENTINGVTATFISPEDGWELKDLPPRYSPDYEAEDGGRRLIASVQYTRVTSNQQGQRLMLSALQEERRARRHALPIGPSMFILEPLDYVAFSSARNGYVDKLFRVDLIEENEKRDQIIYLLEVDPSDYDYNPSTDEKPLPDGDITIVRPPAQAVRDWTVSGVAVPGDTGAVPGLRFTWGVVDSDVDIDEVQFQVRLASDQTLVLAGSTPFVDAGVLDVTQNLRPITNYEARARFSSTSGRDFSWSSWLPATTPAGSVTQSDLDAAFAALIRRATDATPLLSLRADLDTLAGALASQVSVIKENMGQVLSGVGARYAENKSLAEIAQTAAATANSAMAEIFGTVFASTAAGEAEATMRFVATSGTDGVAAQISLQVRATAQDTFEDAGILIQAGVASIGGGSQIILDAARIIFRDSNGVYSDLDATFLKIGGDVPSVAIVSSQIIPDLRDRHQAYQTLVTGAAEVQPPLGLIKGDRWSHFFRQDGTGHTITFKSPDFVTASVVDTGADVITKVDFQCLNDDPPTIFASDFTHGSVTLAPWVFGSHPTAKNTVKTFNPLSIASAGDLLVAFCFFVGYADSPGDGLTAGNPLPTLSSPAGWTIINSQTGHYTKSQGHAGRYDHVGSICHIIAKRLTAADNANLPNIFSNNEGARFEFLRFTGGASGSAIQKVQGFGSGGQSLNMAISSEQNALIVLAGSCAFRTSGTTSLTMTNKDNDYSGNDGVQCFTHIAYKIYNTSPVDETIAMTDSGDANNLVAAAYRI